MKNTFKKSMAVLVIFLAFIGNLRAEDSFSVPVTCIIPAVPGVNAPLIEEDTPKPSANTNYQQGITIKDEIKSETKEQAPTMIQEDKEQEITLAKGKTSLVIVKTIYSR